MNLTWWNRNPEFKKYLWLELTNQRLLVLFTAIIGIILCVIASYSGAEGEQIFSVLSKVSLLGYFFLTIIWGSKLVSESIITEINDKTWDWQKMSSLTPLQLMVGKLFGSSIYTWLGSLLCLFCYFGSSFFMENAEKELRFGLVIVVIGLLSHSLALMWSLWVVGKNVVKKKLKANFFIFFIVLFISTYLMFNSFSTNLSTLNVRWYHIDFKFLNFFIFVLFYFYVWSLVGLYRKFRHEMQFRNSSKVWIAFLFSCLLFKIGLLIHFDLISIIEKALLILISASFLGVFFFYFLFFTETKNLIQIRKVTNTMQSKKYLNLDYEAPLWLVTFGFALFFLLITGIFSFFVPVNQLVTEKITKDYSTLGLCFGAIICLVRDFMFVIWFILQNKSPKSEGLALTILILFYTVIAYLLFSVTGSSLVLAFIMPFMAIKSWIFILPGLIQISILFFMLKSFSLFSKN